MNTRELVAIGFPAGPCVEGAKQVLQQARAARQNIATVVEALKQLAIASASFVDHVQYRALAQLLVDQITARDRFRPRESDAPYRIWGSGLEPEALTQMGNACKLPVAVSGALMPDAHVGYGLPIGGVLATRNAVIPYAVGVDIACRMKMSVLDLPLTALADEKDRLNPGRISFSSDGMTNCRRWSIHTPSPRICSRLASLRTRTPGAAALSSWPCDPSRPAMMTRGRCCGNQCRK